jgi:ERCC4-type nuclease
MDRVIPPINRSFFEMKPHTCPFTILIDDRERRGGYTFQGLLTDANKQHRPLIVPTREVRLVTGDYSIDGFEDLVTIERKTLPDLYGTLGQGRERFQAEHERMAQMAFAAVVIESDLATAIARPPAESRLHPICVYRTWLSWSSRYGVHWWWVSGRRGAEKTTFHALRLFWQYHIKVR